MSKPIVAYITNSGPQSGVGKRAQYIREALEQTTAATIVPLHIDGEKLEVRVRDKVIVQLSPWPGPLGVKTIGWVRLRRATRQWLAQHSPQAITHYTNQSLSFIGRASGPMVVTVHDLIELLEPQSPLASLVAAYLYGGIAKADKVIAVSEYTARLVEKHCQVPAEKIVVIPNGVSTVFHPITDFTQTSAYRTWRDRLKLEPEDHVVLYVGSDHPRKNVTTALHSFSVALKQLPRLVFVKVGSSGREELSLQVSNMKNIRSRTRHLSAVSEVELNELYNLASLLIFPSRHEGFGLPPLEAMAAGCPVVTSNTTSLPEVVGGAGIMHDPDDTQAFTASIVKILQDNAYAQDLRQRGLAQAKNFSWEKAAAAEAKVYLELA